MGSAAEQAFDAWAEVHLGVVTGQRRLQPQYKAFLAGYRAATERERALADRMARSLREAEEQMGDALAAYDAARGDGHA